MVIQSKGGVSIGVHWRVKAEHFLLQDDNFSLKFNSLQEISKLELNRPHLLQSLSNLNIHRPSELHKEVGCLLEAFI